MHLLRSFIRALASATMLGAGLLIVACSDSNGPRPSAGTNLSLAIATLSAASVGQVVASRAMAPSFDRRVTTPGSTHVLVITRAAVSLSRLELATTDVAACASDDRSGSDDECQELETGPMLVELPVDNSVVSMLSLQIPAGTYRGLEAKIHAVQPSDAGGAAFIAAHSEFNGASVRVEGTFDGRPFVYTGAANAELELEFEPPLAVGAAPTTLTVHVSIDRWFTDRNGELIDPASANAGGVNASLVTDNIHRSFHAFEDHDRRGDDGHGDDGFEGPDDHGGDS
jgi:hypothetical protein